MPEPSTSLACPLTDEDVGGDVGGGGIETPAQVIALEAGLWRRFKQHGDMLAREALIKQYLDFARIMAGRSYSKRYRDTVAFNEYMQLASVGLIEAVDRYSPDDEGGASFRTYAAHWIRGAILNGLRSLSEVHAQIEARKRSQRDRLYSLSRRGEPQEGEAEAESGTKDPVDGDGAGDAFDRLANLAMGVALGFMLDDLRIYQSDEGSMEDNCYSDAEMRRVRTLLDQATRALPQRDRMLITRHYFEGLTFDELAQSLALSKGRVSQLHRQALASLRTALRSAGYGDWSV
jgi:RNA polymerase sigma factor for flagellar operon FliA